MKVAENIRKKLGREENVMDAPEAAEVMQVFEPHEEPQEVGNLLEPPASNDETAEPPETINLSEGQRDRNHSDRENSVNLSESQRDVANLVQPPESNDATAEPPETIKLSRLHRDRNHSDRDNSVNMSESERYVPNIVQPPESNDATAEPPETINLSEGQRDRNQSNRENSVNLSQSECDVVNLAEQKIVNRDEIKLQISRATPQSFYLDEEKLFIEAASKHQSLDGSCCSLILSRF